MIRVVFAFLVAISAYGQNPATASFPTSVATDAELLAAKDLSSSTLTSNINNSTTSVPVADGTQFIAAEVIRIDNEQMLIASIATNTLTVSRAYGGTSAASHLSGAAVRGIITSSHHNQLAAEIKTMQARLRDATGYCADAGSNDTYACSPAPCIASYSAGNRFWFKANTANTGAATVNFCSVGAKTIKKAVGGVTTDLADNDIRAGQFVEVIYDGTNMQMLSVLGNAAAAAAWGSISGTLSSQSDLQSALNAKLTTATGQAGTPTYCRSTTGNDTYTCALTPTLTAYTRGGCLTLDADTANTLTASVNVDTLGAKSILNRAGSSLATGDITANKPITICYDGTQYIIQGDGGGSGSGDATQANVQSGSYLKCSVGSGGSPYTCTMTPTLTVYTDGMIVSFVRTGGTSETGSLTLNIDSLGATAIKKHGGTTNPGSSCNIPAGPSITLLTYNAANGVFWLPPCVGVDNRGDAVSGTSVQSGAYLYCPTGGTSTAYTCSVANSISGGNAPALAGYANGEAFVVKMDATSGASPTLNIDSLGAKKIYHKYSTGTATQIAAGELIADRVYLFHYNSSLDSGSGGFETNTGAVDPASTLTVAGLTVGGSGAGSAAVCDSTNTYCAGPKGNDSRTTSLTLTVPTADPTANQFRVCTAASGGNCNESWLSMPLTTKGDLWVTSGGTAMNRLAVGTDGQVLTADAASTNGVKWAAGGGGISYIERHFPFAGGAGSSAVALVGYSNFGAACPTDATLYSSTGGPCYLYGYDAGSEHNAVIVRDQVPSGWTSGAVTFTLWFAGATAGGNTVQMKAETACVATGEDHTPASYNTAQNFASQASTAGKVYSSTITLTMTGCAAGEVIYVRMTRVDTTGYAAWYSANIKYTIP